MSQLRETLLELQKEKTLRLLLRENYEQATEEEKEHYLNIVGDQIESDVDNLLFNYVHNYHKNTPVQRKGKKLRWVYIAGNVILGIVGAFAINEKAWFYVITTGILMLGNQYLPFVYEDD
jgi:hypothetical protein